MSISEFIHMMTDPVGCKLQQWQLDFIKWVLETTPTPRNLGKSQLWMRKQMEYEKTLMEA